MTLSRRQALAGITLGTAALLTAPSVIRAQDRTLVVRDPGGPYTPGFTKAFYEPFLKETGIKVTGLQGEHDPIGMISSMIEARNYVWDGALLSDNAHHVLAARDYLEPIRHGGAMDEIPANLRAEHMMGVTVVGIALAYRTDAFGEGGITSWADIWDIEGKPGYRAMRRSAFDTIEQALLADGVAPEDLYPLDFDRAFAKLDQIRNEIALWWTGGAQTSQLLSTQEVDLCPTWNARAQVVIDGGAPVAINWNSALYNSEGWVVLKGGPKADIMQEFAQFCADARRQALFADDLAYGPTNPGAFEFIAPERAAILPSNPEYFGQMIQTDAQFWSTEADAANERFNAWLLS